MQLPKIFDSISSFRQEEDLPTFDSLNEYIQHILPDIRPWSEDLYEKENYVNMPWKEFRDEESFRDTVVHFFKEGREFMTSINGDISRGSWELMEETNQMILDSRSRNTELYDLAFLNSDFFILKKHGTNKYFVLGREKTTNSLTWREYAESLSQVYESNNSMVVIVTVIVIMIVALLLLLI